MIAMTRRRAHALLSLSRFLLSDLKLFLVRRSAGSPRIMHAYNRC